MGVVSTARFRMSDVVMDEELLFQGMVMDQPVQSWHGWEVNIEDGLMNAICTTTAPLSLQPQFEAA